MSSWEAAPEEYIKTSCPVERSVWEAVLQLDIEYLAIGFNKNGRMNASYPL